MIYRTRGMKRWARQSQWHKWFAWHPVALVNERVWLEHIERQRYIVPGLMGTFSRYRKLSKDNKEMK